MYLCASRYQGDSGKEYAFLTVASVETLSGIWKKRWEEDVIGMKPDVLSVLVGTNDVHYYLQGDKKEPFDFEGWEKCYRSLLDRSLQANPELKIVLGTPLLSMSAICVRVRTLQNVIVWCVAVPPS